MEYLAIVMVWLFASCLVMAFVEYAFHRWPMHNLRFVRRVGFGRDLFDAHSALHHGRYYRDSFVNNPDPASRRISVTMSPLEHLGAAMFVCVPLYLWVSAVGAVCFAVVVALHAAFWTAIHVEMHAPQPKWFSRLRVYRYIRDFHHAHHIYPGKNFGAVFPPLMDKLFGTYHRPIPAPIT